jgi:hypothetical protein
LNKLIQDSNNVFVIDQTKYLKDQPICQGLIPSPHIPKKALGREVHMHFLTFGDVIVLHFLNMCISEFGKYKTNAATNCILYVIYFINFHGSTKLCVVNTKHLFLLCVVNSKQTEKFEQKFDFSSDGPFLQAWKFFLFRVLAYP